ncbi:MAG: primosomal protein N' [Clostridium sp.]|nr:primosomal protein N' [Clostridium sp.]
MSQKYADIIIDISHYAIDKTFQYMIPKELEEDVTVGIQVVVPFGQGNRSRKGYVIQITEKPEYDIAKMKEIIGVVSKSIPIEGKLIQLAAWMKEKYGTTMINCLLTVMPVKERIRKVEPKLKAEDYVVDDSGITSLSKEQEKLVEEFSTDIDNGCTNTYLLHGITGSGKTFVYINCIKKMTDLGRQAIVLVPEIALTYQNVARFKQHFKDRVAVINSKQSKGEKYREFERARNGEVDVVIGPRSALFAPCRDLGLIVIDEEHDSAYKSDQSPRYHAREVALERARLEQAAVILGSATPSLESYQNARLGRYKLWTLDKRPGGGELAEVQVVDMRKELRLGNRSIISLALKNAIEERLGKKEQIMLFLNRRGYNSFLSCRQCGEAVKCPKCDMTLSLHNVDKKTGRLGRGTATGGIMVCHYCGYQTQQPNQCPSCLSKMIGGFGTGTEKVEEEILRLFPNVKTTRMDRDTTTKKEAFQKILEEFKSGEADILIGTQMIVKGHDFENVTLVGVVAADISLFANDYRAGERTFDLITQAAGRAGRGDKKGQVIIQTYQPEHYAIAAAAKQSYEDFFNMEMAYRRLLSYPPEAVMAVVLFVSPDYEAATKAAEELCKGLKNIVRSKDIRIIGPGDATIGKINSLYRKVLYIKSKAPEEFVALRTFIEDFEMDNVSVMLDINPMNMY